MNDWTCFSSLAKRSQVPTPTPATNTYQEISKLEFPLRVILLVLFSHECHFQIDCIVHQFTLRFIIGIVQPALVLETHSLLSKRSECETHVSFLHQPREHDDHPTVLFPYHLPEMLGRRRQRALEGKRVNARECPADGRMAYLRENVAALGRRHVNEIGVDVVIGAALELNASIIICKERRIEDPIESNGDALTRQDIAKSVQSTVGTQ